jgi:hypothetical protein
MGCGKTSEYVPSRVAGWIRGCWHGVSQKTALFDEYARRSELNDTSPEAIDISDFDATKDASTQVQAEYRIIEMERKRLQVEPLAVDGQNAIEN